MSIVGTSWTVVVTDKRSRKLSQSMDDFNVSIIGHSYTVLNFILYASRQVARYTYRWPIKRRFKTSRNINGNKGWVKKNKWKQNDWIK